MERKPGTKLGAYEIVARLGAEADGEVYRAQDSDRGRDVVLKVLAPGYGADAAARRALQQETDAASRLVHPRIGAVYGLEHDGGADFLVTEYVEGETLAARLKRGPLAAREALRIGAQMAGGLGAAHEMGVVHGGLRPGRVLLGARGVKLLGFGLSRWESSTANGEPARMRGPRRAVALAYLAPEQIEGEDADARSDIFALGAILYEMASGRRAFAGATAPEIAAAVGGSEPAPLRGLQPDTPPALERLIRACLAKDPAKRPQAVRDVEGELKRIRNRMADSEGSFGERRQRRSLEGLAWWTAIGALILAIGMIVAYLTRPARHAAGPRMQAAIKLPADFEIEGHGASIAFSPGGARLAVVGARTGERPRIWLRAAEGVVWRPLAGTAGASDPFWSPNGRSIGFFADRMLKRIDLRSGTVVTICAAAEGRGGTWNAMGTILFAPVPSGGLYRVSAEGGTPVQVSVPPDTAFSERFPQYLPGGRRALMLTRAEGPNPANGVYLLNVRSGEAQLLMRGTSEGRYVKPGYLAYVRDGELMAQRFHASSGRLSGQSILVAQGVRATTSGAGEFSFSSAGSLLFQSDDERPRSELTWFSPGGKRLGTVGEPREFTALALSPDSSRAAVELGDSEENSPIWVLDFASGKRRPITPITDRFSDPVWSPNGAEIAYDNGANNLYVQALDGNSRAREIWSAVDLQPTGWSPDGRLLAANVAGAKGMDIWIVPLAAAGKPYPLLATPYNESGGSFSSDGQWFSYLSDESGEKQLYVIPFPGRGPARQISTIGATSGGWVPGQQKLAFETPGGRIFAVQARTDGKMLVIGRPQALLDGQRIEPGVRIAAMRCFARGGKRLLVPVGVRSKTHFGTELTLVTDWRSKPEEKAEY